MQMKHTEEVRTSRNPSSHREDWPEGPWDNEPDKVQWVDQETGLDCLIVRNGHMGNLCGYVGVPAGHLLHKVDYTTLESGVDVHGWLTFSGECRENDGEHGICHVPFAGRPHDVWWFGFDCAHSFDLVPLLQGVVPLLGGGSVYRDLDYVKAECAKLAKQLA